MLIQSIFFIENKNLKIFIALEWT